LVRQAAAAIEELDDWGLVLKRPAKGYAELEFNVFEIRYQYVLHPR
jgi:hypothetical protein